MLKKILGFIFGGIFVRHEADVYSRNRSRADLNSQLALKFSVAPPKPWHQQSTLELISNQQRKRKVAEQRRRIYAAIEDGTFTPENFPYIYPENRLHFGIQ